MLTNTANNESPVVSVIIPAYECTGSIARALDSVFSQRMRGMEVIVVNDGSPDTAHLKHALAPYLSRIVYLEQRNGGPSSARNHGIGRARGKYVAFLDSDDFWFPAHLRNQMRLFESDPNLGLTFANSLLLRGKTPIGSSFGLAPQASSVTLDSLLREECRIGTSSVVASRKALQEAGLFDENLRRCEDFDLWLRMAHNGVRMAYSCEIQVCHRRGNGLAASCMLMKRARIAVYEKVASRLNISPQQRRLVHHKIATGEAEYQIDLAKTALLEQNYSQALAAAQRANLTLPSWKLGLAVRGLRMAPKLFLPSYRAYEQLLDVRNRGRNFLRTKGLGASAGLFYQDLANA
jgi:glycosyltransferase involved in cell wall biosynthesis